MPCVIVHPNIHIEKEQVSALQDRISTVISSALNKPASYIMIIVDTQKSIQFGGSEDPALFVEVKSIGLPASAATTLSSEICGIAEELLAVDKDRIYIEFNDAPREMWGWNGGTF
jgi:phenylpyruvate tautomerase PptA (4-oxalocrotonate tautomerase family)